MHSASLKTGFLHRASQHGRRAVNGGTPVSSPKPFRDTSAPWDGAKRTVLSSAARCGGAQEKRNCRRPTGQQAAILYVTAVVRPKTI
jgi:hypothetical protein